MIDLESLRAQVAASERCAGHVALPEATILALLDELAHERTMRVGAEALLERLRDDVHMACDAWAEGASDGDTMLRIEAAIEAAKEAGR